MGNIGEKVRTLRKARNLSQPELARLVGIRQPSLHNIESNKTKTLRGKTLAGLCRVLNVSPDALLGNTRHQTQETMLHEAEILALWRSLSQDSQGHLLAVARALSSRPRTSRPAAPESAAHTTQQGSTKEN